MGLSIRSPREFWAGILYLAFGGAILWVGRDYGMGTAGRMGPGYFPKVLAGLLVLLGLVALVRSFTIAGAALTAIAWRKLGLVLLATLLFGLLLSRAGIFISLLVLCLVSAAASREFNLALKPLLGLVLFAALSVAIFAKGLDVPLPIWGTWFEPYTGFLPSWMR